MVTGVPDVARVRLDNALRLFDEFVAATVKHPDAATLRGLDRRFAERLQIQPSYWSQIKSRSRQIGERLARQFEILSHKPRGWMDEDHGPGGVPATAAGSAQSASAPSTLPATGEPTHGVPQDDDERFIVGLVLTYYRRHPARARTRLLDLLGEVLVQPAPPPPAEPATAPSRGRPAPETAAPSDADLWQRTRAAVAPLRRKR